MSDRDLFRAALYDAIGWQDSLIDGYSHMKSDPAYKSAVTQKKHYKALLAKYFGDGRSRDEQMSDSMKGQKTLGLFDLMKMHEDHINNPIDDLLNADIATRRAKLGRRKK